MAIGVILGIYFPEGQLKSLSDLGKVIIHWIKLIAGPFLFLTVVASLLEVRIEWSHGIKVIWIALFNTSLAIIIGMSLAHFFLMDLDFSALSTGRPPAAPPMELSFSAWIKNLMPPSLWTPFVQNDILLIALMALCFGITLRNYYSSLNQSEKLSLMARRLEEWRGVVGLILKALIHLIPFAVMVVVAGSVSEYGVKMFGTLFQYVLIVFVGLVLQVTLVYGTWIFLVARIKPKEFFKRAKEPLLYAFGVNSSLATLPLTLKALKELGVSSRSSAIGAGVATNLNNDGIVLYEAMAVFFVMQINHIPMTEMTMLSVALACIVASMGITGIPEAGFISLSVVITSMGLPLESLPLLLSVDWIIARWRSVVNVLSDMTLSIALESQTKKE